MEFAKTSGGVTQRAYEVEFVDDDGVTLAIATVFKTTWWSYRDTQTNGKGPLSWRGRSQ